MSDANNWDGPLMARIDDPALDPALEHDIRQDIAGDLGVDPLRIDDRVVQREALDR